MSLNKINRKFIENNNLKSKRNKSDSENEYDLDTNRSNLRNRDSPLKRSNHNSELLNEESPKKKIKIPQTPIHLKRLNLSNQKASQSFTNYENKKDNKKFFSTPKSERKTSSTQSRLKFLNNSDAIQRNLSNNWADIIEELEEQSKELNEYVDKVSEKYKLDKQTLLNEIETDAETLRKRQKRINFGKVTPEYERYVLSIPKKKRQPFHPRTPNKYRKCSRRKFDGLVKKWRKMLHVWDENPDALKDFKYSIEEHDEEKDEFGGCSGISYDIDDYEIIDYNESDDVDYVNESEVQDINNQ